MTATVEKTSEGTIYSTRENIEVPDLDLLTTLFESRYSDAKPDTVLHAAADHPSWHLTTASTVRQLRQTAHALRFHYGIGANGPNKDIVTVISRGHYLLPLLFYGVIAAGGVYSAASSAGTASELARQINDAGSKLVICDVALEEVAAIAAKQARLGDDRVLIMEQGERWGLKSVGKRTELVDGNELDWERITDKRRLRESLICLLYSSGTTGLPKGVCVSHLNVVAEALLPTTIFKQNMRNSNPDFEYRTLAHLPPAHIAGVQGYLINPPFHGGIVYWLPQPFNFDNFLRYAKKHRITLFFTVPPIYLLIAKSPNVKDHFAHMEVALCGAAPMGKDLQLAAGRRLGRAGVNIAQTWGLSETTGSATYMPQGMSDLTGSVSPLLPSVEARIVDDNDADVPVGSSGEILLRGPVVTNGYFGNPQATRDSFLQPGNWLRTGDVGHHRDGLLYIVDRKKELIKYKGMQVAPAELEKLLLAHPAVLDAAVIGVPDADAANEVPRAYVVVEDRQKASEEEIKRYVRENAASHKQLRGGVVYIDAIPKSPSGKILRKDLRALAKREAGAKL